MKKEEIRINDRVIVTGNTGRDYDPITAEVFTLHHYFDLGVVCYVRSESKFHTDHYSLEDVTNKRYSQLLHYSHFQPCSRNHESPLKTNTLPQL